MSFLVKSRPIDKKRRWALGELKAISKITEKYPKLDILSLKGSYAGAFGDCQFLPSSFLNFAVSRNAGQVPNLFDERDAILSIGNYLKSNGYDGPIDGKQAYDAIFHYNNSKVYVETVRGVARKLKSLN